MSKSTLAIQYRSQAKPSAFLWTDSCDVSRFLLGLTWLRGWVWDTIERAVDCNQRHIPDTEVRLQTVRCHVVAYDHLLEARPVPLDVRVALHIQQRGRSRLQTARHEIHPARRTETNSRCGSIPLRSARACMLSKSSVSPWHSMSMSMFAPAAGIVPQLLVLNSAASEDDCVKSDQIDPWDAPLLGQ